MMCDYNLVRREGHCFRRIDYDLGADDDSVLEEFFMPYTPSDDAL